MKNLTAQLARVELAQQKKEELVTEKSSKALEVVASSNVCCCFRLAKFSSLCNMSQQDFSSLIHLSTVIMAELVKKSIRGPIFTVFYDSSEVE